MAQGKGLPPKGSDLRAAPKLGVLAVQAQPTVGATPTMPGQGVATGPDGFLSPSLLRGYPNSTSKFLRGDGTWAAVGGTLAYTEFTAATTSTSGSTFATGIQVVSAGAVTFDGATKVRTEFYAPRVFSSTTAQNVQLSLADGGPSGTDLGIMGVYSNTTNLSCLVAREFTPPAASKTYSVVMWMSGAATGTIQAGAGGAGTQMPGYIKVLRV